jgi:hypothetical protein
MFRIIDRYYNYHKYCPESNLGYRLSLEMLVDIGDKIGLTTL